MGLNSIKREVSVMKVDLDAKVRTKDGKEVGSVAYAIINPDTNQVTEFVITTGIVFGRDVLIPRTQLEEARQDGEHIILRFTQAELKDMPPYVPENYIVPPPDWIALGENMRDRATGYLWPAS